MNVIEAINEKDGLLFSKPATENQIVKAEEMLGLRFSTEYKEYIANFGAASFIGHELTGISDSNIDSVIFNTIEERKITSVPDDWYVIERAGIDGIVMWQSEIGEIFVTQPNCEPRKLYNSLTEYVLSE